MDCCDFSSEAMSLAAASGGGGGGCEAAALAAGGSALADSSGFSFRDCSFEGERLLRALSGERLAEERRRGDLDLLRERERRCLRDGDLLLPPRGGEGERRDRRRDERL